MPRVDPKCVKCQKSYAECLNCEVYRRQNTACELCGSLKDVKPFIVFTRKGPVKIMACEKCRSKLT